MIVNGIYLWRYLIEQNRYLDALLVSDGIQSLSKVLQLVCVCNDAPYVHLPSLQVVDSAW
jgi:hypothetical protein